MSPTRLCAPILLSLLLTACRSQDSAPTHSGPDSESLMISAVPASFSETVVASLIDPTAMAMAPDGRLFVCQKSGRVRIVKASGLSPAPFLAVNVDQSFERGLLGIAFDPDFDSTRFVYVYYTTQSNTHNRVSRFTASNSNPDTVVAGSETPLLELDPLGAGNHNGGALQFGQDGKLYIAVGENAVPENSQSLANLFGKILRINKDGSIPADNPFYATASGNNRAIWALGLRNPYTFAIQPGTGRMYINDVGNSAWEEINEGAKGANYGWPATEGATTNPGFATPVFSYRNTVANGTGPECAIVGAAFYNPVTAQFPSEYVGDYFFGDHCAGWIKRMGAPGSTPQIFAQGITQLNGLMVGSDGALYYATQGADQVVKITYASGPAPPEIFQQPRSLTVTVGEPASFTVSASGAGTLAYRWQRNGTDIPGATAATFSIGATAAGDSGDVFRAIVSNSNGSDTSENAELRVTVNRPPAPAFSLPASSYVYRAGDTLSYAGSASDPEDGELGASALTWVIDFHHGTHMHPFMAARSGVRSGSLAIPVEGETASDVWLRIHLTATDSRGLQTTIYRDVQPVKSEIVLRTDPEGLDLALDGSPVTAPHAFTGVAGIRREIGAASQNLAGRTYQFTGWSDGGEPVHSIFTPDTARTYTASFREISPNRPPVVAMTSPDTAFRYQAGSTVSFSAEGSDPEQGELPDSAFTWRVYFHHDAQVDDLRPTLHANRRSGSFPVPTDGVVSANVFYRIFLSARDDAGLITMTSMDVRPLRVDVTLASDPSGLKLKLEGQTVTTPYSFTGVAGVRRSIAAIEYQDLGQVPYEFVSWSDSGAASHTLATPSSNRTITARFRPTPVSTGIRAENLAR